MRLEFLRQRDVEHATEDVGHRTVVFVREGRLRLARVSIEEVLDAEADRGAGAREGVTDRQVDRAEGLELGIEDLAAVRVLIVGVDPVELQRREEVAEVPIGLEEALPARRALRPDGVVRRVEVDVFGSEQAGNLLNLEIERVGEVQPIGKLAPIARLVRIGHFEVDRLGLEGGDVLGVHRRDGHDVAGDTGDGAIAVEDDSIGEGRVVVLDEGSTRAGRNTTIGRKGIHINLRILHDDVRLLDRVEVKLDTQPLDCTRRPHGAEVDALRLGGLEVGIANQEHTLSGLVSRIEPRHVNIREGLSAGRIQRTRGRSRVTFRIGEAQRQVTVDLIAEIGAEDCGFVREMAELLAARSKTQREVTRERGIFQQRHHSFGKDRANGEVL